MRRVRANSMAAAVLVLLAVSLADRWAAAVESIESVESAELVERFPGVTYIDRDGEPMKADIYVPPGKGPFPAVLCVHGGAWTVGSRGDMTVISRTLAERGYTAMTITYRLAPQHKFPAQFEDCREALYWMHQHADEYKIDRKRIAALGYSAGGHLVTLMGVTGKAEDTTGAKDSPNKFDSRLKAVVAGGAPCDFRNMPPNKRGLAYWLGGTRAKVPEVYEAASPAKFVSADTPPTFFFHGENDRLVKIQSPTKMVTLLKEAGVPAEMYVVPEAGHIRAFLNRKAYGEAIDFLDKYMKPAAESAGPNSEGHPPSQKEKGEVEQVQ